jgi:hypothetical protein
MKEKECCRSVVNVEKWRNKQNRDEVFIDEVKKEGRKRGEKKKGERKK